MKNIFIKSADLEKNVKTTYKIPDFLMMENAAVALEKEILDFANTKNTRCFVFIVCGSGNNGADGLAVARRVHSKIPVNVLLTKEPKTQESVIQKQMAEAVEVNFVSENDFLQLIETCIKDGFTSIFLDCLYGTGFHGTLPATEAEFFNKINKHNHNLYKIACDVPSGFAFNADLTVTMGIYKSQLYSDLAKEVCGKIITADLGFSSEDFEKCGVPDAYLIEKSDCKLPLRKNPSAHKGNFGHAVFFAGEKCGAAIIGAEAALQFGSGLVSLIKVENSNLEQFKISPELMISDSIPQKTNAMEIGSGLGTLTPTTKNLILNWAKSTNNPSLVLDADIFNYEELNELLTNLNSIPQIKIILTPHLKELESLLTKTNVAKESGFEKITIADLQNAENKIKIGKAFCQKYKNITLIMKSACTFIASENQIYICADGTQSLAKAGSGDVLAGMCTALLAQGYSAKDAAITAVEAHALAGTELAGGAEAYSLTPEKLIEKISNLTECL